MTTRATRDNDALRLMRTVWGGRGFRSRPLGEFQDVAAGFSSPLTDLAFSLTLNLHFLCLFARSQNQFRPVEETVNDVHISLDAVIHHLRFAISADHDENGS